MLENNGVATCDLIEKIIPNESRRKKGAYAMIECFQHIPCNPCFSSCPRGAIQMPDICDLPKVDFEKCNGCGLCAVVCPGLAIFIIDETYSETETLIKLPYEFLPLPKNGDIVDGINRSGEIICKATVKNVVNFKSQNRTPMIWLSVPKEFAFEVRCFSTEGKNVPQHGCKTCDCLPLAEIDKDSTNDAYICRCEEITVSQIRDCIAKGYTTLDEIKRFSRAGMGACQGRTCRQLIMNEIATATGQKQDTQPITTFRPTAAPIKMRLLCKEDSNND